MASYERFTDRARKVMQLARQEAARFGHSETHTPHILIALLKEGHGVAANVLTNLGVGLPQLRATVESVLPPYPDTVVIGRMTMTNAANKVAEYAIEESRNLEHTYVGTEHILLALDRDETCASLLAPLGASKMREEVIRLLGINKKVEDEARYLGATIPVKALGEYFIQEWFGERCKDFDGNCEACKRYFYLDQLLNNPWMEKK